jgi:hypothetical protein
VGRFLRFVETAVLAPLLRCEQALPYQVADFMGEGSAELYTIAFLA